MNAEHTAKTGLVEEANLALEYGFKTEEECAVHKICIDPNGDFTMTCEPFNALM